MSQRFRVGLRLGSMIDTLQRLVARLMNRVRVNRIQQDVRDGVPVFVKRRRAGGSVVIWFGNRFLAWAGSGICMFVRPSEWVAWEVHCAGLLYPERPPVKIGPGPSVIVPKVGGRSLRALLDRNEAGVARELRRVHQISCRHYGAGWSHGDVHLDNILYDPAAGRAVLIDFDTRHCLGINQTRRHSDDLQVLLLELIGRPDEQRPDIRWRELATAVIEAYGDAAVLEELRRQLFVPRGWAKILWHTRTNCVSTRRLEPRLDGLREIIQRVTQTTSLDPAAKFGRDDGSGGPT
jgi:hypothetical protein